MTLREYSERNKETILDIGKVEYAARIIQGKNEKEAKILALEEMLKFTKEIYAKL